MKTILPIGILALAFSVLQSAQAGVIVLEGHYQGKPLYIQNPFAGSGVGFCTYEVTVNDNVTTDEINSSAFEVDFSSFQLELGAAVVVKIKHKDDCSPKIINPEVLKPKSTFEIQKMELSNDGVLTWTTANETGILPYVVEQFRWNKWVKVGEVDGKGTPDQHNYSFRVVPHSGENQFRLKQVDYSGKPRYSPSKKYKDPSINEISFSPKKASKEILFTGETLFEVYNQYGNIVKKGFAEKIDISNLKKGVYYVNYDNKFGETFVKK